MLSFGASCSQTAQGTVVAGIISAGRPRGELLLGSSAGARCGAGISHRLVRPSGGV